MPPPTRPRALPRSGVLSLVAIALALSACSPQPIGYGVALVESVVGGGEAFAAAERLVVMAESEIEDTYRVVTLSRAGERTDVRQLPSLQRWRARIFATQAEADLFADSYAPLAATYGYADRNSLPVRAESSATATIVYQLREAEAVKIIGRSAQQASVGEYENYWYEVLTEDGTSGFTFGEFLPVFESSGDPAADVARLRDADPLLDRVLATTWRPEYFRDMVASGRIDLRRMRPEIGLFPRAGQQILELRLEESSVDFRYEQIERRGEGLYILRGVTVTAAPGASEVGTDPRLTVLPGGRLSLSYTSEGRLVTPVFVDLGVPLSDLIAAERARRDVLYADLMRRASTLTSSAYGTITLRDDRTFSWKGAQALQPRLLPAGSQPTGELDFRYHMAPGMRERFDGVLTFSFAGRGNGDDVSELNALFAYDPAGVRMVVAGDPSEDLIVDGASRSALVIYFAFDS